MNLQMRLELQGSLQEWVDSTMNQFNITAADMEDAVSRVLLKLKDQVLQDYLIEQHRAYQEALSQQEGESASLSSKIEKEE